MNNFYIKQGATQPILVMKLNKNSQFQYENFQKSLENSSVTFSMKNIDTNILKIAKKPGGIILNENVTSYSPVINEYYIYYKFTEEDTNLCGKYVGEFMIQFYDTTSTILTGTFIAPIQDNLIIEVQPSLFYKNKSQ